jgi:hypothetical protein
VFCTIAARETIDAQGKTDDDLRIVERRGPAASANVGSMVALWLVKHDATESLGMPTTEGPLVRQGHHRDVLTERRGTPASPSLRRPFMQLRCRLGLSRSLLQPGHRSCLSLNAGNRFRPWTLAPAFPTTSYVPGWRPGQETPRPKSNGRHLGARLAAARRERHVLPFTEFEWPSPQRRGLQG